MRWFARSVMAFRSGFVLLCFLQCLAFGSVVSDDGATLLEIKKSFRDVDSVLYEWTDPDYCAWRGVTCDNVTFNVVALNLSGLNLDGEISPAIGDLKGLLSIDLKGKPPKSDSERRRKPLGTTRDDGELPVRFLANIDSLFIAC